MKERNFLFDNAKAILITLVVVGHFADYYTPISDHMKILFFFIYLFHMPLFIFISGVFSKSAINGDRVKIERILSFLILYVGLKLSFYFIQRFVFLNEQAEFRLFIEGGLPWFMFAMAAWVALTYLLRNIKARYLLIFSIALALYVGFDKNVADMFVASRVIVYFPYFLMGYYLNAAQIANFVKTKWVMIGSWMMVVGTAVFVYLNIDRIYQYRFLLTGRNSYAHMENEFNAMLLRLFLYAFVVILSTSLLAITPKSKTFFSYIGSRTLQIYFLHHLILSIYMHFEINGLLSDYFPNQWLKIYLLLSFVLTWLLAFKWMEKPFGYISSLSFKSIQNTKKEP